MPDDRYRSSNLDEAIQRSLEDRDNQLKDEERHTGTPDVDADVLQRLRAGFAPLGNVKK